MVDLEQEFALTTDGLDATWLDRLQRWGIPDRAIYGPRHLVDVGRIVTHSTGLFEFHPEGDPAVIVAEGEPEVSGWADVSAAIKSTGRTEEASGLLGPYTAGQTANGQDPFVEAITQLFHEQEPPPGNA